MKQLKRGVPQTIILDQDVPDGKNVVFSIIGEDGKFLLDINGAEMKEIPLQYLNTHYEKEITIAEDTPEQYARIFFDSTDYSIEEKYKPEDVKITSGYKSAAEIVPVQYFIDYILSIDTKGDRSYKKAVQSYIDNNRTGLREKLLASQNKLENKTKLYFSERTIKSEKKDYFFDRFNIHLWQFAVENPPINNLEKFEIQYADTPIADIDTKLFVWDRLTGIIEFLPVPGGDSAGLYTLLMSNLSGVTLTILSHSNLERIPAMFRATYKTGIFYSGADEIEKAGIRDLICVRTLREILPIIDPSIRASSESESIDGVSASKSYAGDRLINLLKENEDKICEDLMLKYGRSVDMVIV